jgi:hypothetical protein
MRIILLAASALVFLAGFQLFILTDHTDLYFAWTIQPSLTAAFLGAGYFSSFLLEFLASREKEWCRGRIAVPAVFTFTTLTLVATLLHIDRFHFASPYVFARTAAWFWLAIYALVPPALLLIWIHQVRVPGNDSSRTLPLASWIRIILGAQSIILLTLGVGLFLATSSLVPIWPWKLTPLTGQAVGAWLIGLGIFAAHSVRENDRLRIRSGLISYLMLGLLQLVALFRYPSDVNWAQPNVWVYLLFLFSIVFVGLFTLTRHR